MHIYEILVFVVFRQNQGRCLCNLNEGEQWRPKLWPSFSCVMHVLFSSGVFKLRNKLFPKGSIRCTRTNWRANNLFTFYKVPSEIIWDFCSAVLTTEPIWHKILTLWLLSNGVFFSTMWIQEAFWKVFVRCEANFQICKDYNNPFIYLKAYTILVNDCHEKVSHSVQFRFFKQSWALVRQVGWQMLYMKKL